MSSVLQAVMKKAIEAAPDSWMPGGEPDPLIARKNGVVGTAVSRVDGPAKVEGRARFSAEFPMDGMLYAAVVHSTIAKGGITSIDTSAAEAAPGVHLVMTFRNAPKLAPTPLFGSNGKAAGGNDLAVMQDRRVHWNGQPVAVVLADSQEEADHAKSLVAVRYHEDASVTSYEKAKANGAKPGVFQGEKLKLEIGDAEAKLAAAPHRIDVTYTTPRHNHNPIELHAVTVAWKGDGDTLSLAVHDASQGVTHTAWSIAHVFGLKEEQVHVTSPFVGGGFGSKTMWDHHILAAAAAKLVRRPVRMVLSREGVYRVVGGRTTTEQRVAMGARDDGHLTAIIHTGTVPMTAHNNMPEPFILATRHAYRADAFKLDVETVTMDMVANTFMRAPGESVGTFGLECGIDELAVALDIDPIELRVRNEPEKDPTEGNEFSSRHIVEAYRAGAERFGWSKRNPVPGSVRDGEWLVGMGCATATYPYYRMPGGAARLILREDPSVAGGVSVRVEVAAHEMGMGTSTTHAMVVADRLGMAMDCVEVCYGDSRFPGLVLAGGSQQTASIGSAVMAAQEKLFEALLELVGDPSPLKGAKPGEVEGRDGGLAMRDDPSRRVDYALLLSRTGGSLAVLGEAPQPLEFTHWSMHSHGAMFCEVGVNVVTGEPRVRRFLGSFDCGRILNAKTAASQFRGGIVMGLGLALMEETQFDERNGRIMNPSLAEYHVPVHLDVPEIDVIWTDIADPHTPMGAHGIGEIGITGVAAAVANAVYNATGKRVRDLPITLDKLL